MWRCGNNPQLADIEIWGEQAMISQRHAGPTALRPGFLLVLSSIVFNFLLCFLNNFIDIHNATVAFAEFLIILAGCYYVRKEFLSHLGKLSLASLYFLFLIFINPKFDVKIVLDIMIMCIFFWLGKSSNFKEVNLTLWVIIMVVLIVGAFELFFSDTYAEYFDIWQYYVNKGTLTADIVNYAGSNLYVSAIRGAGMGRTFFQDLLGRHRVSSVFLEPVSMGNFAVVLFAWALCARFEKHSHRLLLLGVAMLCVILGDSRFGAASCVVMALFRQSQAWRSRAVVFLLPLLVMVCLVCIGELNPMPGQQVPRIINDDFPGRLLFSGQLLSYWTWPEWLGLEQSRVYVEDTGYAYFVNSLGLIPAIIALGLFAGSAQRNVEATMMQAMISVYFATGLCVGASAFSIKTGSLLWFLYGAAVALPSTATTAQREPEVEAVQRLQFGVVG